MILRRITFIVGAIFLVLGVAGFIPTFMVIPVYDPVMPAGPTLLFGMFAFNALHNIVNLALGAWGLLAARTVSDSRLYCRSIAVLCLVLAVMGLMPITSTFFGLFPLYDSIIGLNLLTAIFTGYFGFVWHEGQTFNKTSSAHP